MSRARKNGRIIGATGAALAALALPAGGELLVYEGFDTGVAVDTNVGGAGLAGATSVGFAAGSAWSALTTNTGTAKFTASGLSLGFKFATAGGALRVKTEDAPAAGGTGANAYRQSGVTVPDGATLYGSFLYRPEATSGRFTALMGVETGYSVKFDGTALTYGAHRLGDNDDAFMFTFQPDAFNSANNNYTGGMKVRRYLAGSFASVDASTNPLEYTAGVTYLGVWKITNMSGYATNPDGSSADPSLTAQSATLWILTKANFEAICTGGISEAELDANNLGKFFTTTSAAFRAHLVSSDFINIGGLSGGSTGGQSGVFDEIRIGTTLDAVLPVVPPVAQELIVTRNGTNLDLQWPGSAAGMRLEKSTGLAVPGSWSAYPATPAYSGGLARVSVPPGDWSGKVFFRLKEPAPAHPFPLYYNAGNATVGTGFWSSIDDQRVSTDSTTSYAGGTSLKATSDQTKSDRYYNPSIPPEEPDRWHSEAKKANVAVNGDTRWFGLAVKFDGATRNASRTFAQWMDVVGYYPSVMFTIAPAFSNPANNSTTLWRLNMKVIRTAAANSGPTDEVVVDLVYGTVAEMYDVWHRVAVKTYFTSGTDGYIQVWYAPPGGDYELIDLDNGATYRGLTFRNVSGSGIHTFTAGCYAFWSGDASGSDIVHNWIDEVRVADNSHSLQDVAP